MKKIKNITNSKIQKLINVAQFNKDVAPRKNMPLLYTVNQPISTNVE